MVCKTTQAGATPARDSICPGIGVERHTPVFQTGIEGALPSCPSISQVNPARRQRPRTVEGAGARPPSRAPDSVRLRFHFCDAKTGAGHDFTGVTAAVQLRLRVAFGLQALQRCSGLLNRRARGSTVATHHFRIRGEIIIILRFERRVCRWESCRMHQFTGMWFNPNSRGSRLRIWQPWGCKSLHAHHFTATGFSGNSRPRRLKIAEPSGCKSRVADRRVVRRE